MTEAGVLKDDDIVPVSLACNDRLVGGGFVGVAGEGSSDMSAFAKSRIEPRPAIVDLSLNHESQTEVVVLNATPEGRMRVISRVAH